MIIMIGGAPCTGKSTLMRSILQELSGDEYALIEPMKLFPCQIHGDILVIGYYPEGETFGGTDKISHGAIPQFRKFIEQVSKYLGFKISWRGKGLKEVGYVSKIFVKRQKRV